MDSRKSVFIRRWCNPGVGTQRDVISILSGFPGTDKNMAASSSGLETSKAQLGKEGSFLKCRDPEKAISVIADNQWKMIPPAGQQKEG